jgi:radical SAM protein with 4Fe4S-binding SPASM domain
VLLCREDIGAEHQLGNIFQEKLEEIWKRGEEYHRSHIREEYPDICSECDEYYTFNF